MGYINQIVQQTTGPLGQAYGGYQQGGWGGAGRSMLTGAGMDVLGKVPYAGPALQGAAGGAMSPGLGSPTGLSGKGMNEARKYGVNPQSVRKPKEQSKGRKTARGALIGLSGSIPYVGPAVQAGLTVADQARQARVTKQYQSQVQNVGKQNIQQINARATQPGPQKTAAPAWPGAPGGVQVGGNPQNVGKTMGGGDPATMNRRLYRYLLSQGIPESDLGFLTNAATQAAQDTRQSLDSRFARTGDSSGWDTAAYAGLDNQLNNKLASLPAAFRQSQRDYLSKLMMDWRTSAHSSPQAPGGPGTDVGGILSGIGSLGQAGIQGYQTGREAGWWGQTNKTPPSAANHWQGGS